MIHIFIYSYNLPCGKYIFFLNRHLKITKFRTSCHAFGEHKILNYRYKVFFSVLSWSLEHLSLNFTMDMDSFSIFLFLFVFWQTRTILHTITTFTKGGMGEWQNNTNFVFISHGNFSDMGMKICYKTTTYIFLNKILTNNLFFFCHMQVYPSSHGRFTLNCMANHMLLTWHIFLQKAQTSL